MVFILSAPHLLPLRCQYLPSSKTLLLLRTSHKVYPLGKSGTRLTAPGPLPSGISQDRVLRIKLPGRESLIFRQTQQCAPHGLMCLFLQGKLSNRDRKACILFVFNSLSADGPLSPAWTAGRRQKTFCKTHRNSFPRPPSPAAPGAFGSRPGRPQSRDSFCSFPYG